MKIDYSKPASAYTLDMKDVKQTPGVYITPGFADVRFISFGHDIVIYHCIRDSDKTCCEPCDWTCWKDHNFIRLDDTSVTITF